MENTNSQKFAIKIEGVENLNELNLEDSARIEGAEGLSFKVVSAPEGVELAENERVVEIFGAEQGIKYKKLQIVIDAGEEFEPVSVGLPEIYIPTDEEVEALAAKEAAAAAKAEEKAAKAAAKAEAKAAKLAAKEEAKAAKLAAKEAAAAAKEAEAEQAEESENEYVEEQQAEEYVEEAVVESTEEVVEEEIVEEVVEEIEAAVEESVEEVVEEYVEEEVEEIIELTPEEIKEATLREQLEAEKALTDNWLTELKEAEQKTVALEGQLKEIEVELAAAVEASEASEAEAVKEEEKAASLKAAYADAKSLSDQAAKSVSAPDLSEAVMEKLQADADDAAAATEKALAKYESQQEVANTARAKANDDRGTVNGIVSESKRVQKEISGSIKNELRIKDKVIVNLSKKGARANSATKTAWKLEDAASLAIFKLKKAEKETKKLVKKSEAAAAAVEEAELKVSQEADEEKRQILEAELAQFKTKASNSIAAQTKAEKIEAKLFDASEKATAKSNEATDNAELLNAVAIVSQDAARKVQNIIINELEGRVSSDELSEDDRLSLTQEIDLLKEQSTEEFRLNEATDRPRFIIADDMKFAEKWVKANYKRTYWIIFERGYRSRDAEFEKFLIEIKEKQEAAQKEIDAKAAEAAAELARIKEQADIEAKAAQEKADRELAEIRQHAADEKAAAEAEVAKAKAEGEALIASQKEELDAKLHEAENLVKDNNAKNEEVVKGLNQQINDLNKDASNLEDIIAKLKADIENLNGKLEASEKARTIAEKKAAILAQIEEIVEEDTAN